MGEANNEQTGTTATPMETGAPGERAADGTQTAERPLKTSDDFLVPGPTAESNEGLARWGCTWLAFSLILILLMLAISFICLTLATWTGIA